MSANNGAKKKSTEIKVLLIGDSYVGKTTLLLKYLQGEFIVNLDSTWRGVNLFRKMIESNGSEEGTNYYINIWDIAGNRNYVDFFNLITQPMHAVIFVASSEDFDNLESSVYNWNELFKHIVHPSFSKFLIINKKSNESIDTSNLVKVLQQNNILKVFIVDPKISDQVKEAFEEIFEDILTTIKN